MGKQYTEIDEKIKGWISKQRIFFVSTAPLSGDGHINCSPKGLDCFRVLGPKTIGYVDTGGSGIETLAHLRENGRIVIMMCAFDGPPKIFRFYGVGRAIEPHEADFDDLLSRFPESPAARNIIVIDVEQIIDSCGYSIPRYDYQGERDILSKWATSKGEQGVTEYQQQKNRESLDGLPGVDELE